MSFDHSVDMLMGLRSLKLLGVGIFGMGTTVSVCHTLGQEQLRSELLKISDRDFSNSL